MKVYRLPCILFFPVMILMAAGCATKLPMVSAGRYSQLSLTPTNTIALSTKLNSSPSDTELSNALIAGLQHEGFKIVSFEQADYILAYTLEDEWPQNNQQSTVARPMPSSQTTAQLVSGAPPTDASPSTVDTSFTSHSQGIRLVLYTNPKTHPGSLQIVWQGCIDPGKSISSQNEPVLIRTLLGYFGRDHNGRVNLVE